MFTDSTGYAPEWLETTLAIFAVATVVVGLLLLAPVVGGLAAPALSAIAFATGFGAISGGYKAFKSGSSIAEVL